MKKEEKILCMEKEKLNNHHSLDGERYFIFKFGDYCKIISNCNPDFYIRKDVETNYNLKQIIPYVIIKNIDDKILIYQRKGNEKRLHNLWSCGIGGHINESDGKVDNIEKLIYSNLKREVFEETGINKDEFNFLGVINEENTDVGRVHIGLVFVIEIQDDIEKSDELNNHKWVDIGEVKNYEMEIWSNLAIELLKK